MSVGPRPFSVLLAGLVLCACAAPTGAPTASSGASPIVPAATAVSSLSAPASIPAPSATPYETLSVSDTPRVSTETLAPSAVAVLTPLPRLRQLTTGGCCVQPYWSASGSQVRFVDRPSSGQPTGIWAVDLTGGAPTFVTPRLGIFSPDESLVAYPESGQTYIERSGGARWRVDNGGRAVAFSPDSRQIAWQAASSLVNFDSRQVEIWVAAVDGTGARRVARLTGGGLAGWFPDGQRLLVTSHDGDSTRVQALRLHDSSLAPIVSAARLQSITLSPLGGWLAYAITFSGDASLDGSWVVRSDGSGGRRLGTFGSLAWRGEGRLLVIPLDTAAGNNRLLAFDAATGAERALTDPSVMPFQIAQGNWSLSPDGAHLAFVSAADHNIWVIDLTE